MNYILLAIVMGLSGTRSLGELRVTSIDGWCDLEVDGVVYGVTPTAGIMLTEGYHQVRCTTLDKRDSEVFPIKITANKIQRMKFVLLQY